MCGIAGFWNRKAHEGEQGLKALAQEMADSIHNRGPDAGASWADAGAGVAFGHRRLSIIDLSEAGAQPMNSSCGRFVICYNGEIYNTPELRKELEATGRRFVGHSDTEVIVEACGEWGVTKTVCRLIGMFAMAIWDRQERALWLVRDRLGIKPLYWGQFGDLVLFSSELKALRVHPGWSPELDRDALAGYMRHNYIPCPQTIYEGVHKLPPGCLLRIDERGTPEVDPYWSLEQVAREGQLARNGCSDAEIIDGLETLLSDAVRRRMVADVPLGAFLSGGVDSSTVVALMQQNSERPVRTFSIGFHEEGFDEARYAKEVARHLGTDHTELYVSEDHAQEVIPNLPEMYDEPFADSSQIPTFLVSELTRQHVAVSLSGDGGDELFAGYNRYYHAEAILTKVGRLPAPARSASAALMRSLSPQAWTSLFRMLPHRWRPPQAGDKMHKLASIMMGDKHALYRRLISHWEDPNQIVLGSEERKGIVWDKAVGHIVPDFTDRMQYLDTLTYLPDDILTKVDRSSMAVSLEARVPLLDHRVVEMAWRLPKRMKFRDGQSKWALRQVLYRHVPRQLIDRPKMGFGVPIHAWLRGPLREWAEELLGENELRSDGILNPAPIREKWREHLSGHRNWQYHLWDVLMFQAWKQRWL
jgi:asparagine synthase (glutamine-hydrolysing)